MCGEKVDKKRRNWGEKEVKKVEEGLILRGEGRSVGMIVGGLIGRFFGGFRGEFVGWQFQSATR